MSNKGKGPNEVEFNTVVGKNIRYLRKSKKLTQTDIGNAIGVSFQQIQKYEKGSNGLHSYSLYKVAHRVFNISMDVLADPQMIIKHEGFKNEKEFKYWEHQDELKDQATNWIEKNPKETKEILNLEPKVIVGSLEKIKDQLKKDGIDPEENILPTLRELTKKNHGIN